MSPFDCTKYRPAPLVLNPGRRWPDRRIEKSPRWASVDLRDGNQALLPPMDARTKGRLFDLLVQIGIKEIEVGFPSASATEFSFVRQLIRENRIPEDVTIQVLAQAREDQILRSFEALDGARRASMHIYNSLNPVQRTQVFRTDRAGVRKIAREGARLVKEIARNFPGTLWTFQYTPESFSATESDVAVEVSAEVTGIWKSGPAREIIVNLPATVELSTPNVYADQVEYFIDHLPDRENVVVSVHTHNDRGTAIAAAELAVMAGADRVEGTLFGNGERTGNMDLLVMAMNLYSQGVDPLLDLSRSNQIASCYTECTGLPVCPRHPWFGERVYTAASGGHQDAIRKGLAHYRTHKGPWTVPYLPIDPGDIGRADDALVRIGSQSGKGGIAYVLEKDHGIVAPAWMLTEFCPIVKSLSERGGAEIDSIGLLALFEETYLIPPKDLQLVRFFVDPADGRVEVTASIKADSFSLKGKDQADAGASLIDVFCRQFSFRAELTHEMTGEGPHRPTGKVLAFVRMAFSEGDAPAILCGAGLGNDPTEAHLQAILKAVSRRIGMLRESSEGSNVSP